MALAKDQKVVRAFAFDALHAGLREGVHVRRAGWYLLELNAIRFQDRTKLPRRPGLTLAPIPLNPINTWFTANVINRGRSGVRASITAKPSGESLRVPLQCEWSHALFHFLPLVL